MNKLSAYILTAMLVTTARADLITSTNAPVAIPDNNALGIQQTIDVTGYSGLQFIESLSINLTISGISGGAFNGDFYVTLQHDSGFVVLLNRVGVTGTDPFGYANNGFNITLAQTGNDIHSYQNFSPTYGPSGRLLGTWGVDGRNVDPAFVTDLSPQTTSLNSFTNASPNGTWTLFVADVSGGGQGQLDSWAINMTVVPEPATFSIMLLGLLGLRGIVNRRKQA